MNRLTLRPLSREEVRSIDVRASQECGMPTIVLMENAGRGAAEVVRDRLAREGSGLTRVVVLCGPGNNGGDGAVVVRHLDLWGFAVRVFWIADPSQLKGDAAVQWAILKRAGLDPIEWREGALLDAPLAEADVVVDALLGTGLTRPVEGPLRAAIEAVNRAGKPVLALDLPSGLDADEGVPLGVAVRATVTATFVAPKRGFGAAGASDYTGEVVVVDIGAPRRLLEPFRA